MTDDAFEEGVRHACRTPSVVPEARRSGRHARGARRVCRRAEPHVLSSLVSATPRMRKALRAGLSAHCLTDSFASAGLTDVLRQG